MLNRDFRDMLSELSAAGAEYLVVYWRQAPRFPADPPQADGNVGDGHADVPQICVKC